MTDGSGHSSDAVYFRDLGLPAERLEVLDSLGFEHPTPIQAESIPVLLAGRDVVGIAQTGTGKTAAFGLPLLTRIDPRKFHPQALVLAPTRELAIQTTSALQDLMGKKSPVQLVTVYGGSPYGPQLRALREGTHVVVGTPGRIIDLIERGALDLAQVNTLVLDEADEMLRMGFAEEVETIISSVPKDRLTALYSATMPKAINNVAKKHLHDPVRIEVSNPASTVDTIHQTFAVVPTKLRFEALCRFLSMSDAGAAIVFVRTRKDAEEISLALSARGFRASGISGDIAQRERERLLEGLRRSALDVLVATDVAARGIDVARVGLVVNYEVPREAEQYVHRIGRTGRAGRLGESLTLFTSKDVRKLRQIERLTGTKLEEVQVPSAEDVRAKKTSAVLADALKVAGEIPKGVMDLLEAEKEAGMRYRDIAAALLTVASRAKSLGDTSIEAQQRLDASFLETPSGGASHSSKSGGSRREFRSSGNRYRIEVGKRDGANPGTIVGTITGETGMRGSALGRIEMFPSFSVVEFADELSPDQMQKIDRATIRGRRLRISEDRGGKAASTSGTPRRSQGKQDWGRSDRSRQDRGRTAKTDRGRGDSTRYTKTRKKSR